MTVVYQNGLPVISVRLPSRRERCQFTLKPISDSVGVFLRQLQEEDRGIDRVAIYSPGTVASTFNSHPKLLSLTLENTGGFALQVFMTAPFLSLWSSGHNCSMSADVCPQGVSFRCSSHRCHPKDKQAITFHVPEPLVITVGAECVFPVAETLNVYQNSVCDLRIYNKTLKTLI